MPPGEGNRHQDLLHGSAHGRGLLLGSGRELADEACACFVNAAAACRLPILPSNTLRYATTACEIQDGCGRDTCVDAGDIGIRYLKQLEQRQIPARWRSKYSSP
jgi:hypothetical protein